MPFQLENSPKNGLANLVYERNLCIDGGYEICGEMYNKNILSPLKSFIPKVSGPTILKSKGMSDIET